MRSSRLCFAVVIAVAACSNDSLQGNTGPVCGNGIFEWPEACDDANTVNETDCEYGTSPCDWCNSTCTSILELTGSKCGDGIIDEAHEACDDGNEVSEIECFVGTAECVKCNSTCTGTLSLTGSVCGDGVHDDRYEQCDDGPGEGEGLCVDDCSGIQHCGDLIVSGSEPCDDGPGEGDRQCLDDCSAMQRCGNGTLEGDEVCDLGVDNEQWTLNPDDIPIESCNESCSGPTSHCGDGVPDPGFEDCDRGLELNDGTPGGCASDCTAASMCDSYDWESPWPGSVPLVEPEPFTSYCMQSMPPTIPLDCDVPDGPSMFEFFVNVELGSDYADGTSPGTPFQTISHAIDHAPEGSVIRVAEGLYGEYKLNIRKELVIKGGYNDDFTQWNPSAHKSYFRGRLWLDHNLAVVGGFYMASALMGVGTLRGNQKYHELYAGTVVGNYIEVRLPTYDSSTWGYSQRGIYATGCEGSEIRLLCNDMYFSGWRLGTPLIYGIGVYLWGDGIEVRGNRICADYRHPEASSAPIFVQNAWSSSGNGPVIANNVVENTALDFPALWIDGSGVDWDLTVTNNTIVGAVNLFSRSEDAWLRTRWTNNIFFGRTMIRDAFHTNLETPNVEIVSAENNLVFGFADNSIVPSPSSQQGNDTSGDHSGSDVFVDYYFAGDFSPVPGGPADGTGLNVFGDPVYGDVTVDLYRVERPETEAWDRGALQTQEE